MFVRPHNSEPVAKIPSKVGSQAGAFQEPSDRSGVLMDPLDGEDRHGFNDQTQDQVHKEMVIRMIGIRNRWSSGSSPPRRVGFLSSSCLSSGSVLKVYI